MRIVVASTPLPADLEARSRYRAFLFEMSDLTIDGKMPLLRLSDSNCLESCQEHLEVISCVHAGSRIVSTSSPWIDLGCSLVGYRILSGHFP